MMRDEVRAAEVGRHVSAAAQAACTRRARPKAVGAKARAERT